MGFDWEYSNVSISYPFEELAIAAADKEAVADALVLDGGSGKRVKLHALSITSWDAATIDARYDDGSAFFSSTPTVAHTAYGDWHLLVFSYGTNELHLVMTGVTLPYSLAQTVTFVARVHEQDPSGVSKIIVTDGETGLVHELSGNVTLSGGYNVTAAVGEDITLYGRTSHTVTLNAIRGSGLGLVPGDCDREVLLRTINGVAPDEFGRFILQCKDCYRCGPAPVSGAHPSGQLTVLRNALKLHNDCVPCCECADYDNVYKAMSNIHEEGKLTGIRLARTIDDYVDAKRDWEYERIVRERPLMKLFLRPTPEKVLGIQLMLLNNRAGTMVDMSSEPPDERVTLTITSSDDDASIEGARILPNTAAVYNNYYGDPWVVTEVDKILFPPQDIEEGYDVVLATDIDTNPNPSARKRYHIIQGSSYLVVFFEMYFPAYVEEDEAEEPVEIIVTATSDTFLPDPLEETSILVIDDGTGVPVIPEEES